VGQPCCGTRTCAANAICTGTGVGTCTACGGSGERCCANESCLSGGCCIPPTGGGNSTCTEATSACANGSGVCLAGACVGDGGSCGGPGNRCCSGFGGNTYCTAGKLTCSATDAGAGSLACEACGGSGQPCCPGFFGTCDSGLTCVGGGGGICQAG
jgi:hypothetical protein